MSLKPQPAKKIIKALSELGFEIIRKCLNGNSRSLPCWVDDDLSEHGCWVDDAEIVVGASCCKGVFVTLPSLEDTAVP